MRTIQKLAAQYKAIWNPDLYHGWFKKSNYFEGWYIKLIDPQGLASIAFIPGISMDQNGNKKAFIQVLDGLAAKSYYYHFEAEEFISDPQKFSVRIGANYFSKEKVVVDLPEFKGEIEQTGHVDWPAENFGPGVMGWYGFVPFMQCYHGVVSMDHRLSGNLSINGNLVSFDDGRGYMEKDWGRSFPKAWIWMQTNHFKDHPGTSIMFSIAHIPWLTGGFIGFLGGLYVNGKVYPFATYNNTKYEILPLEHGVQIELKRKKLHLSIMAYQADGADLKSPIAGDMLGKVNESMQAVINVKLKDGDTVIFEGHGTHGGMEMAGDVSLFSKK